MRLRACVSAPNRPVHPFNPTMPALRLLYVEDHADLREVTVMLLEEEGLAVFACASAEAAQTAFAAATFDVLMTDVNLPTLPGTELATRLQQGRPDLWVVFCSGSPMQQGLNAWGPRARALRKPFEADDLHAVFNEIQASIDAAV